MENLLFWFGGWVAKKVADAVFDKILQKVLSDENVERWMMETKRQLLGFYLTVLVRVKPLQKLK